VIVEKRIGQQVRQSVMKPFILKYLQKVMKHIRYRFLIDDDVMKHHSIRNTAIINYAIMCYLNHPEGWSSQGYFFEPVDSREKVLIRLAMPKTIKNISGCSEDLSCAELGGRFMYLNADRWFNGSEKSKLNLDDYRQYLVSHEIGHILGHGHQKCPCKGCKAPIMMQQTLGIGNCKPNTSLE
jgi:hypothetical protein